jgi:hypothetical protein
VRLGEPKDKENYNFQRINAINVYVPVDFVSPYPLVITVQSLFGIKTLHVEGWKII